MAQIKVRNGSDEDVKGQFDGKPYEFLAGETSIVPIGAAVHIFGYGHMDKTEAFLRLGWLTGAGTMAEALERLKKFSFSEQVTVFADEIDHPHISGEEQVTGAALAAPAKAHKHGAKAQSQPL